MDGANVGTGNSSSKDDAQRLSSLSKATHAQAWQLGGTDLIERKHRDSLFKSCVELGMNARMIVDFSLSWARPITTTQQVYKKIESMGLQRIYKSKKSNQRRTGNHNKFILYAIAKICGQSMEYGYEVWGIFREKQIDVNSIRPDFGFFVGKREFYGEVQTSKIPPFIWLNKMRGYLKMREKTKRRFAVLILVDKPQEIDKVRQRARKLLEGYTVNMFLFMTIDDFGKERDVAKSKVWQGAWNSKDRFSLLE